MVNDGPIAFLEGLLGRTLHITIADGRLMTGETKTAHVPYSDSNIDERTGCFKATDREGNIILSNTFEYRKPGAKEEARAVQEAQSETGIYRARATMSSRYIGLVTIGPSQFRKIELEEDVKASAGQNASLSLRQRT